MRIVCTTTFIHGRDRFEAGDVRAVDDETVGYFVSNGWASEAGAVTLDVKNGIHASSDNLGGPND